MADKPSTSTEKMPEKANQEKGKAPSTKINNKKNVDSNETESVVAILGAIQSEMRKQTGRMVEQEKRMQDQASEFQQLKNRLEAIENYDEEYYSQEDCDYENYEDDEFSQTSSKRKSDNDTNDENNNRFKSMAKKFKAIEQCDKDIDSTLAGNITELFQNGIDEERYEELIKSESTARPENCEGLVVVKLNQMIWDAVSTQARGNDKKLQNIETSVIKAASVLSKVVDRMASMEADLKNSLFGDLIDKCDDVLALMGHANRQINLTRKDLLRPELNKEYSHLCSYHRPYTSQLFGDDVSKSARELEDCSKISNKLFQNKPFRGPMRRRPSRGFRFRGGYGRGNRGRGFSDQAYANAEPKNYPRRGGSRPFFKH